MWFFNCLDKELGDEVLKANPGTPPQNITEDDLVACTKKLAVKVESKLIHRIKMGQAIQPPGTGVNNFLANLKGLARQCNFTVTCKGCGATTDYSEEVIGNQLVRGLGDGHPCRPSWGRQDRQNSNGDRGSMGHELF